MFSFYGGPPVNLYIHLLLSGKNILYAIKSFCYQLFEDISPTRLPAGRLAGLPFFMLIIFYKYHVPYGTKYF